MLNFKHPLPTCKTKLCVSVFALLTAAGTVFAADIDIYGPSGSGSAPNAIFLLDSTASWNANNQNWNAADAWNKCVMRVPAYTASELLKCQAQITSIYYPSAIKKKPWESGYQSNKDNVDLKQGEVQVRALKLVLNELVCANTVNPISVNVGLALIGTAGSVRSGSDRNGMIFSAVEKLVGPGTTSSTSCFKLLKKLDDIDQSVTAYQAGNSADYGTAMFEIFKYFGGYADPTKASTGAAGTPIGTTGYGPQRFSVSDTRDDLSAFNSSGLVYKSPISASNSCSANFMVLVGNGYPKEEPNNGPASFNGLNYTPPTLPSSTSDTSRYADEWAYFLANSDVSSELGTQSIKTYVIDVYKDAQDLKQTKLLKSMAAQGGVGSAGYLDVKGDLTMLLEAFKTVLTNIAAVDSVFTATTLPVSTTTQGTYLNQVFVGMFKPDANYNPRWLGNLKQYELGFTNGVLDLKDSTGKSAIAQGFFAPEATSYWSEPSVFFDLKKSGTPVSSSDAPDGKIVEKGGSAQQLRKANLQNASSRTMYTILPSASPALGTSLSATPFTYANVGASYFSSNASWVNWIRGENNVSSGNGMEDLNGSYTTESKTVAPLSNTGARASIHGDVLHSRPIALNYGTDKETGGVVVYYGSNDGFFRAIDGRKTGVTAGSELWSFIAPELYSSATDNFFKRLYEGGPFIQLPENGQSGTLNPLVSGNKSKPYGMDGPIGAYARYNAGGSSLLEGIIYPTMRRGGNAVYAMDVTSKTNPKYLWKIKKDATYTALGQTWSIPKPVVLKSSAASPPFLLVMGGGYDPKEDELIGTGTAITSINRVGNAIYIINGRTGALIKALPTDYSVPSDVTLVDVDRNGEIDRGYVADVRGNLYRFDFPSTGDLTLAETWATVTSEKIANLNGKVFFPPDVLVTRDFVAVMVGTGDREKPLQNTTSDNFFLIKDKVARTVSGGTLVTLQKSDLTRVAKMSTDANTPVATNTVTEVNDVRGCYLELATNGEKVVNAPLTVSGVTYFGTNRPTPSNANQCTANLGQAYAYQFPLFCGVPPAPTKIDGGGLAPNPVAGVVLIPGVDGKEQKVNFLIGGGKGGSNFTPVQPEPAKAAKRTRLYWKIDNANR